MSACTPTLWMSTLHPTSPEINQVARTNWPVGPQQRTSNATYATQSPSGTPPSPTQVIPPPADQLGLVLYVMEWTRNVFAGMLLAQGQSELPFNPLGRSST